MMSYKGLVFVKHGRLGSHSEGPDYYLQTSEGEHLLRYQARHPWAPDYHLEYFCRCMVEVRGAAMPDGMIQVDSITEILTPLIPGT